MKRRTFLQSSALLGILSPLGAAADPMAKPAFRFGFLTDMHVKPETSIERSVALAFQHAQKQKPGIDFIINGGDTIMDALAVDQAGTAAQWKSFQLILKNENSLPIRHVIGNHDVWGWFIKENRPETNPAYGKSWAIDELKMPGRYYHFSHKGWDFIVLDSTQLNPAGGYIAYLDEEQLGWLSGTLASIPASRPVAIISHIPILSICAGLFFEKTEANGDRKLQRNLMHTDFMGLKKLFLQYPNIKTCLSGHIHLQDEVDYLGVKYYCNGAVSGSWWKGSFQEFPPAYAVFEFFADGSTRRKMVPYS